MNKTSDILLDLSVNLHSVKREPTIDSPIYAHHVVVKGFKYTLVANLSLNSNHDIDPWNQYFSGIHSVTVFGPDNDVFVDFEEDLLKEWISSNFLYQNIDRFPKQSYESFEDFQKNSPLIELEYVEA